MGDRLLTVEQVCDRVQLGPDAIRRAIRRGELTAHKIGGRHRIPPAAVDQWLRDTEVSAAPTAAAPTTVATVRQNLDSFRLTL